MANQKDKTYNVHNSSKFKGCYVLAIQLMHEHTVGAINIETHAVSRPMFHLVFSIVWNTVMTSLILIKFLAPTMYNGISFLIHSNHISS